MTCLTLLKIKRCCVKFAGCRLQEVKIRLMPKANNTFIYGSTNYKPSMLKDHASTETHKRAVQEEELEKLHNVSFKAGAYENENSCRDFIASIAQYLFDKNIYQKLMRVNFIAVLCDGSTDNSVMEQEVIYVIYTDPNTFTTTLAFF